MLDGWNNIPSIKYHHSIISEQHFAESWDSFTGPSKCKIQLANTIFESLFEFYNIDPNTHYVKDSLTANRSNENDELQEENEDIVAENFDPQEGTSGAQMNRAMDQDISEQQESLSLTGEDLELAVDNIYEVDLPASEFL